MAVEFISMTCPQCNANLKVASDRESFFCEFCGKKILVYDSNHQRYTYRKIDDARIREAEVKQEIRIRELEAELEKAKLKAKGWTPSLGYMVFVVIMVVLFFGFFFLLIKSA